MYTMFPFHTAFFTRSSKLIFWYTIISLHIILSHEYFTLSGIIFIHVRMNYKLYITLCIKQAEKLCWFTVIKCFACLLLKCWFYDCPSVLKIGANQTHLRAKLLYAYRLAYSMLCGSNMGDFRSSCSIMWAKVNKRLKS